jgi:hypothetical protein
MFLQLRLEGLFTRLGPNSCIYACMVYSNCILKF